MILFAIDALRCFCAFLTFLAVILFATIGTDGRFFTVEFCMSKGLASKTTQWIWNERCYSYLQIANINVFW